MSRNETIAFHFNLPYSVAITNNPRTDDHVPPGLPRHPPREPCRPPDTWHRLLPQTGRPAARRRHGGAPQNLLETAGCLFLRKGYGKVSLEMIAREAHVAVRTIYVKFGGKSGLFNAVIEQRRAAYFATMPALETDMRPIGHPGRIRHALHGTGLQAGGDRPAPHGDRRSGQPPNWPKPSTRSARPRRAKCWDATSAGPTSRPCSGQACRRRCWPCTC